MALHHRGHRALQRLGHEAGGFLRREGEQIEGLLHGQSLDLARHLARLERRDAGESVDRPGFHFIKVVVFVLFLTAGVDPEAVARFD